MAIILCAILGLAIGLIAIGMYYHSKNKTIDQICKSNSVGRSQLQKLFRTRSGYGAIEYF